MKMTKEQYAQLEELLGELQLETIKSLLKSVKSGEATSGDIRNALTLLKDNSINLDHAKGDPMTFLGTLSASVAQLPYLDASLDLDEED